MRPMKVLVYVDGSDAAMRAVDRAIDLAVTGADVLALHVYPPSLDRGMVSHFEIEPEDLDAAFASLVAQRVVAWLRADPHRFARNLPDRHGSGRGGPPPGPRRGRSRRLTGRRDVCPESRMRWRTQTSGGFSALDTVFSREIAAALLPGLPGWCELHPAHELRLLGLELGIGEHALVA